MLIDLRSDTVTRPGKEMLEFMMKAPVGDMVLGDDPMVNELETRVSDMFGMEAALFCPSGTMTNQIAIKIHTQPGDDVICSKLSHIYQNEGGGIAFHSAASVTLIETENGIFTGEDVLKAIQPDDPHKPRTSLVSAENSVNMGGGAVWDIEELKNIAKICREKKLAFHLDVARLFNAIVRNHDKICDYGEIFATISLCLSKGLGAPVGSVLLGNRNTIARGVRLRKLMGGGMRQAGYMAAAGLYALENNIERLEKDHENAGRIADALHDCKWIEMIKQVQTNIIILKVIPSIHAGNVVSILKDNNILVLDTGNNYIRMVTHLDISSDMVDKVISTFVKITDEKTVIDMP